MLDRIIEAAATLVGAGICGILMFLILEGCVRLGDALDERR